MKEVKIITLRVHGHFARNTFDGIDETVKTMYKKGYEFKGYIPSEERGYGYTSEIKLIFDKEY